VVSPDLLSPGPISSIIKTPEKTQKKTLMTLDQQMNEVSKWNT
jgi:hypothetical protein